MIRLALIGWIAALAAGPLLAGCGYGCDGWGCGPAARMCVPLGAWSRIEVCRNEVCDEVFATAMPSDVLVLTADDYCVAVNDGAYRPDGDIYTLTSWDVDGNELFAYRWTATYWRRSDPEPRCNHHCSSVELDESTAE